MNIAKTIIHIVRDVILNLDNHLEKQQKELTNVENVDALYMEDITIVYHVPRKRVLLINQIIKIIKRESMDFSSVKICGGGICRHTVMDSVVVVFINESDTGK